MIAHRLFIATALILSTRQVLAEDVKQELEEVVVSASRVEEKIYVF